MSKFEYRYFKRFDPMGLDELNELGEDGWEMCGYGFALDGNECIYYFKKLKQ